MSPFRMMVSSVFICASLAAATPQTTQEPIRREDLPAPVLRTVQQQSERAIVRSCAKEIEAGRTLYRVRMTISALQKQLLIDSAGRVVEIRAEVPMFKVPDPVRAALERKAGNGHIFRFESISRNDVVVAYEAQVNSAGGVSTVAIGPDGKPLPPGRATPQTSRKATPPN